MFIRENVNEVLTPYDLAEIFNREPISFTTLIMEDVKVYARYSLVEGILEW